MAEFVPEFVPSAPDDRYAHSTPPFFSVLRSIAAGAGLMKDLNKFPTEEKFAESKKKK